MVTRKPPIRSVSESISEVSAHMCRRGLWWSVLRISIAAIVISGAYIAGMICGMQRGEYDNEGWGEYQDRRMEAMGRYGSPMMKGHKMMSENTPMMDMSHDPMAMSMVDMGKMLEGKTGDALDRAFLEGMIPHHQAAVDMAKSLAKSDKPELVKLGAEIIAAQMKEIEQMKAWQVAWGYTSSGMNGTGMMMNGMHMMPDGTMMQM